MYYTWEEIKKEADGGNPLSQEIVRVFKKLYDSKTEEEYKQIYSKFYRLMIRRRNNDRLRNCGNTESGNDRAKTCTEETF